MAKVVRVKKPEPEKKDSGKRLSGNFEFKHSFLVSIRDLRNGLTFEQVQEDIKEMLAEKYSGVFTPSGGLILIDGRACYPHDFDYGTMDRKPGTHPPLYTLTQEEQKEIGVLQRIEREAKNPNALARNPTNLLTTHETDRLKKLRQKTGASPEDIARGKVHAVRRSAVEDDIDYELRKEEERRTRRAVEDPVVEWSEEDAKDEALAERETAKLIKKLPARAVTPKKRPGPPARLKRRA